MKFEQLDGAAALGKALGSLGKHTRLIVCGPLSEREMLEEQAEFYNQSVQNILENAGKINIAEWLQKRKEEYFEDFEQDEIEEVIGEWPGQAPSMSFGAHTEILTGEPLKQALLAEVSISNAWEIPAHFGYGGWNECPAPEEQCAIWKYWYEKFGVEIVAITHDVIEAKVANPPSTKEAAMELAWEQYLYCNDIVDQGVESISNLGATLRGSDIWYFWWD
jgi:hypothetical protein